MSRCGIAVMAKASLPGHAKTRLVPPLTHDEAALFNTAFLKDIAANLMDAGREAGIAGYMAYGPPESEAFFRENVPTEIGLFEAWLPDFGDCLFATLQALFARGHEAAVVLNSDSPTLPTSILVETARVLAERGDRAVLGPASDGGYYLLGLKAPHARMFEDIDWSTDRVARQTLERAAELGLPVHILPTWYDVDDLHALQTLHAELQGAYSFATGLVPHHAVHTERLMSGLIATAGLEKRLRLRDVA
jgi:uncharacterized protein